MNAVKEVVKVVSDFVNGYRHKEAEFVFEMSNEHRTLQQSFTGLCFAWIKYMAKTERVDMRNEASHVACKKIIDNLPEGEYDLSVPCI